MGSETTSVSSAPGSANSYLELQFECIVGELAANCKTEFGKFLLWHGTPECERRISGSCRYLDFSSVRLGRFPPGRGDPKGGNPL